MLTQKQKRKKENKTKKLRKFMRNEAKEYWKCLMGTMHGKLPVSSFGARDKNLRKTHYSFELKLSCCFC